MKKEHTHTHTHTHIQITLLQFLPLLLLGIWFVMKEAKKEKKNHKKQQPACACERLASRVAIARSAMGVEMARGVGVVGGQGGHGRVPPLGNRLLHRHAAQRELAVRRVAGSGAVRVAVVHEHAVAVVESGACGHHGAHKVGHVLIGFGKGKKRFECTEQ